MSTRLNLIGMLDKIKEWIKLGNSFGIPLPMLRDEPDGKPSFTLLCVYLTFVLAFNSVVAMHFTKDLLSAGTSIMFWVVAMVFYRLKKISKAKLDLDDKSIELEDSDKSQT